MVRRERRRALREALEDLARYRHDYDRGAFLGSRDVQRQVLQALYVAVQACVDEAFEACRARGIATDVPYREAFLGLGQAGALAPTAATRLADWASFRNVLAHFYPVLDLDRVWVALDNDLDDLVDFERWLLAQKEPEPQG